MSVFHHRAQLIARDLDCASYVYFPDIAVDPTCNGEFKVNLADWSVEITRIADAESRVAVASDEQCVSRLVAKLRAQVTDSHLLPGELVWIA